MQKLDCSPLQWGAQLALVNSTSIPLNFLSGVFESVLLARGVAQLTIRRCSVLGGAIGMGVCSTMYLLRTHMRHQNPSIHPVFESIKLRHVSQ